jgi:hypothetical protein
MRRLNDSIHRNVEFGLFLDEERGEWKWTYYPKIGQGVRTQGTLKGTREDAAQACKLAIDEWLGPESKQ